MLNNHKHYSSKFDFLFPVSSLLFISQQTIRVFKNAVKITLSLPVYFKTVLTCSNPCRLVRCRECCSTRSYKQVAAWAASGVTPTVTLNTILWGLCGLLWESDLHSLHCHLLLSRPLSIFTLTVSQRHLWYFKTHWWQTTFIVSLLWAIHWPVLSSSLVLCASSRFSQWQQKDQRYIFEKNNSRLRSFLWAQQHCDCRKHFNHSSC